MRLKLRKNQSAFPNEVLQETSLKTLEILGDGLISIPSDISKLTELESLTIQAPLLETLPKEVFEFKKLKILKIKNCAIEKLITANPSHHLEKIQLAQTSLTQFPGWLFKPPKLSWLYRSHNNRKQRPVEFSFLENLKRLILDNNKFEELPHSIFNLKNLKHLSIDANKFSDEEKERITDRLGIWF